MPLPQVIPNDTLHPSAREAAQNFLNANDSLDDKSYWPVRMFTASNLFLWHLEAFAKDEDPVQLFADEFNRAAELLNSIKGSGICRNQFPSKATDLLSEDRFEDTVSGLFSDVWVGMTDEDYFDQSYEFTQERLSKNGVNPEDLFGGKVVVDAGCGGGKFSAALARFGAKQVIGLDIGDKGLDFAREQAKKVPYGDRLDYRHGSLLDIPLDDASVDMVWSNGVIHHTLGYEKCVEEFARIVKPGGDLFLYVNGRFGLFELLLDTLRLAMASVPRSLFQHYLVLMGINSGRIYWIMDCLYAPYEWKSKQEIIEMLQRNSFEDIVQLTRGVAIDQIEQVSTNLPYAEAKYGEAQLKFLAKRSAS
jgi:SAM-dependent methyltransferase